jgi:hypothetical protein
MKNRAGAISPLIPTFASPRRETPAKITDARIHYRARTGNGDFAVARASGRRATLSDAGIPKESGFRFSPRRTRWLGARFI